MKLAICMCCRNVEETLPHVFKNILTEINVVSLKNSKDIFNEFKLALNRKDSKSTLLIENGDYYNSK